MNVGHFAPEINIPECQDDTFKGLIASFLTDDEGLGIKHLKKWIDEGLVEIEQIINGELDFYDMWGQAWGAEITRDSVLIYWGYDDTEYEETMPFDAFYIILRKWREFLDSEPSKDNIVEFEVLSCPHYGH